MRHVPGWLACTCLALSSAVFAGDPPTLNAQVLGVADGVATYCSSIDSAAADQVRQVIKQLKQGASDQQLAEVRNSDEYRKAYKPVSEFTGKIDRHHARQFCAEGTDLK
jgi:hypothetical protein